MIQSLVRRGAFPKGPFNTGNRHLRQDQVGRERLSNNAGGFI
jgi:hypothetical protein